MMDRSTWRERSDKRKSARNRLLRLQGYKCGNPDCGAPLKADAANFYRRPGREPMVLCRSCCDGRDKREANAA